MKTKAIILLAGWITSTLLAVPEIPIRADKELSHSQLVDIYTAIESDEDGITICEKLDSYGWFTELPYEGSAVSHPYIRYKEFKNQLIETHSDMDERLFSTYLFFLKARTISANNRGLQEKNKVIRLVRNEPNQSPDPTPTAVTPDADASGAPSAVAGHL